MKNKIVSVVGFAALLSFAGCWWGDEKQATKNVDEQKTQEVQSVDQAATLTEQEKHIAAHSRGQGHMYKEVEKKVFPTVEDRKELFKELGIEYIDHTIIGYKPLFRMDMKDCERYQEAPYYYDEITETYGKYVQNRYLAPMSLRWLGDDVGYGVFASEDILADGFIGIYTGEVVARQDYMSVDYAWAYPLKTLEGGKIILDAKFKGNEMRFVNDSRTPNCVVKYVLGFDGIWHVCYVASKLIKKGEQILVSYGEGYWKTRQYAYKEMAK